MTDIVKLLQLGKQKGASDLHIVVARPPLYRIHGSLVPAEDIPAFTSEDIEQALKAIITDEETAEFKLKEDSTGLTMNDYRGIGIRPAWLCGPDDIRCAKIYSWALATAADQPWAAELKPEVEE